MIRAFNQKLLYSIPIIFLIVLIFRISYSYFDTKNRTYEFAKKEGEILSSYILSHRKYYQKLFLNNTLVLNKDTIKALPVYSSVIISREFSAKNSLHAKVRTVSDVVRNPKNRADALEMKAIDFFKKNRNTTDYFDENDTEFYQYAKVLKIEPLCLKCHGKREDAPKLIREKYDKAYNYKLGDIRGIVSIKIPKKRIENYFLRDFYLSALFDFLLFLSLFAVIYYLAQKSKNINTFLKHEVDAKTEELKKSLSFDKLTGLPNRFHLIEDLNRRDKSKENFLAIVNIDDFKDINDFYGHDLGDSVLIQVADKILQTYNKEDVFIYKLPSDEYAIFSIADIPLEKFISKIEEMLNNIEESSYKIGDNDIYIRVSCGLVYDKKDILAKADTALKVAKNTQKSLIVYEDSLSRDRVILNNIEGISLLKRALDEDLIVPFFQPIFNIKREKIEKFEALVRIVEKDGTVIPPYKFLDISVKSKLYPQITKIVMDKTFEFFRDKKEYEFSINISIEDILNPDTYKFIISKLDSFEEPERVVFEIVESDKIDNYESLGEFINLIKTKGCKVAIDDFGSGYSNFSHILSLNVDYLKIDASLIKNILVDENSRKITQTIIYFAKSLGIETIAEYVENEEILKTLKDMGADFAQGYYIGKPKSDI